MKLFVTTRFSSTKNPLLLQFMKRLQISRQTASPPESSKLFSPINLDNWTKPFRRSPRFLLRMPRGPWKIAVEKETAGGPSYYRKLLRREWRCLTFHSRGNFNLNFFSGAWSTPSVSTRACRATFSVRNSPRASSLRWLVSYARRQSKLRAPLIASLVDDDGRRRGGSIEWRLCTVLDEFRATPSRGMARKKRF